MSKCLILAQALEEAAPVFFGLGVVGLVVALLAALFWLAMLIHALTNPALETTVRLVWALVIFFLPFLGALAYLFIGRKGRSV